MSEYDTDRLMKALKEAKSYALEEARIRDAARDLLAMLEHAVHWHDQLTKDDIVRYQAVISKAKGE